MSTDISSLMAFLVPQKSPEYLDKLIEKINDGQVNWEELLFQANFHLCTPLWYSQLKKDGLLDLLPDELAKYLFYIYELNMERNEQFQVALEEILRVFNKHSIDSILLKGAATYCDNLFELGTRVMGDLDILVPIEKVPLCQNLIVSLGYKPIYELELQDNKMPLDEREHHIARHEKLGTPVVVEIHFKVSHGQAGRVFKSDELWSQRTAVKFRGCNTSILSPNHRLLLNTVHAMIPLREYLSGNISVLQWSEFVFLINRYGQLIDWKQWLSIAKNKGFSDMFKLYYLFAMKYFQIPKNKYIDVSGYYLKFNEERLLLISLYQNKLIKPSFFVQLKLHLFKLGYYVGLVKWLWNNQCYSEDMTGFFERSKFCLKKLISKESRKNYWLKKL